MAAVSGKSRAKSTAATAAAPLICLIYHFFCLSQMSGGGHQGFHIKSVHKTEAMDREARPPVTPHKHQTCTTVTKWRQPWLLLPCSPCRQGVPAGALGANQLLLPCAAAPAGKDSIEGLLALGANRWEASGAAIRRAAKMALTPMLNMMSVMGVVSIPGMMTGQILAGADPTMVGRAGWQAGGRGGCGLVMVRRYWILDPGQELR